MSTTTWKCPKCGGYATATFNGESVGTLGLSCHGCGHVWWEWPLDHPSRKPKPKEPGYEVWYLGNVLCRVPPEKLSELYADWDTFPASGKACVLTSKAAERALRISIGLPGDGPRIQYVDPPPVDDARWLFFWRGFVLAGLIAAALGWVVVR